MPTSAPSPERSLPFAPPPWTCKATAYVLPFYHSASSELPLDIVYDPLELHAGSFSSEKETGKYVGGLGFAQIFRYSESPVGAYDELAILPGFFSSVGPDGKKRKDSRITGIWVSQVTTLINGRRNWNIPKHLARFSFTPADASKSSPIKVEVYRAIPGSSPPSFSTQPFFSATIHPISYLPVFPMSSSWLSYLGISTSILQPPLPTGDPTDLVVGTTDWKRSLPVLTSKRAKMVWIDLKQPDEDREYGEAAVGREEGDVLLKRKGKDRENWWPGMGRWHLGVVCEDATLKLGEPAILSG